MIKYFFSTVIMLLTLVIYSQPQKVLDFKVTDYDSNPEQFTKCGNYIYAVADNGFDGEHELFRIDSNNISLVYDNNYYYDSDVKIIGCINSHLIFSATDSFGIESIYSSLGDSSSTDLILDTTDYWIGDKSITIDTYLYFKTSFYNNNGGLWKTNGTLMVQV